MGWYSKYKAKRHLKSKGMTTYDTEEKSIFSGSAPKKKYWSAERKEKLKSGTKNVAKAVGRGGWKATKTIGRGLVNITKEAAKENKRRSRTRRPRPRTQKKIVYVMGAPPKRRRKAKKKEDMDFDFSPF